MDNRYDLLPSYYYKDNNDGKLAKSVGKPLRDYKIYGESIQGGLPTPDAPVDIESVGEAYFVLDNDNIYPFTEGTYTEYNVTVTAKDGVVTIVGETTSATQSDVVSAITFKRVANYNVYATISAELSILLEPGTYIFNSVGSTVEYNGVCLIIGDIGKTAMSGENPAFGVYNRGTFTIDEPKYCMPLYIKSKTTVDYTITDISLVKQTELSEYKVPLKVIGKNIADLVQVESFVEKIHNADVPYGINTTINVDDNGRQVLNVYAASGYKHEDEVELRKIFKDIFKENTRYTISFDFYRPSTGTAMNLGVRYTDGTLVSVTNAGGVANQVYSYKYTTAANKTVESITTAYHDGYTCIYLDTLQIEEGTEKTKYEKCIGTNYIYLDEPLRKVLEPPTAYTNIVDIDYILENNPQSTTSLERVTFQDRDCIRWQMGSKASALRIMQGKFKENTVYTIKASMACSKASGGFEIVYTNGTYQRILLQNYAKNFVANEFRDILVFTCGDKTIDYIRTNWSSDQWCYVDLSKFVITEGVCHPPYLEEKSTVYGIPVYSNSKNLANPLSVYNFACNVNTLQQRVANSTVGTYIIIDENGREILNNYCATGHGQEGYSDANIIFEGIFKANTQYTLSFDGYAAMAALNMAVFYTDNTATTLNASSIYVDSSTEYHYSFTTKANATVDCIRLTYANGTNYIYLDTLQIEEGTEETEYIPYVLKTLDMSNPYVADKQHQLSVENCADYIDYRNKRTVKCVDTTVFTGEENWQFSGVFNRTNVFYLDDAVPYTPLWPNMVISNYFTPRGNIKEADWLNGEMRFQYGSPDGATVLTAKRLYVSSSDCASAEDLKAWIAEQYANGTPVTVCYLLSEEQYEPLELPKIRTSKGDCTVSVDTTIKPSKTEYQYYKGGN